MENTLKSDALLIIHKFLMILFVKISQSVVHKECHLPFQ